jgi:CheY-like chemotaxis protein/HPt (histidine-containing phosphotransfer) domain-containing protein
VPFLFTSFPGRSTPAPGGGQVTCLSKPIKPDTLQRALAESLAGIKAAPAKSTGDGQRLDTSLAARFPLRVLLTDDNLINQKVASRLLQQLGYRADIARNGLEAIQALERQPYDLVFMDVQMPVLDGLEATRQIRQKQGESAPHAHFKQRIGIVAMTANAMQGDRDKCITAGMDDYIPKPVRPEMIQAVIERLAPSILSATPAPAPTAVPVVTIPVAVPPAGLARAIVPVANPQSQAQNKALPVDLERLDEFSGGNAESFNELVTLYLTQTSEQIQNMQSALNATDLVRVARLAHSCAGASSTCGMVVIAPLLRKVEASANARESGALAGLLAEIQQEFRRIQEFLRNRTARS